MSFTFSFSKFGKKISPSKSEIILSILLHPNKTGFEHIISIIEEKISLAFSAEQIKLLG